MFPSYLSATSGGWAVLTVHLNHDIHWGNDVEFHAANDPCSITAGWLSRCWGIHLLQVQQQPRWRSQILVSKNLCLAPLDSIDPLSDALTGKKATGRKMRAAQISVEWECSRCQQSPTSIWLVVSHIFSPYLIWSSQGNGLKPPAGYPPCSSEVDGPASHAKILSGWNLSMAGFHILFIVLIRFFHGFSLARHCRKMIEPLCIGWWPLWATMIHIYSTRYSQKSTYI